MKLKILIAFFVGIGLSNIGFYYTYQKQNHKADMYHAQQAIQFPQNAAVINSADRQNRIDDNGNFFSASVFSQLLSTKRIEEQATKHDLMLPALYFSYKSSSLDTSCRIQLDNLSDYLKVNPAKSLFIIAYAMPDEGHAMHIAQQRAESVKSFLVRQGIDKRRINTLTIGDQLNQDAFPSEQQHNRKVRLRVY